MELDEHPFGKYYFHKPTGKVVMLQQHLADGSWRVHFRSRESFIVWPRELRPPTDVEVEKQYPHEQV